MTTTKARTLTATLPNGETISRSTKANYTAVGVVLNTYTGRYEVVAWSAKASSLPIVGKFVDRNMPTASKTSITMDELVAMEATKISAAVIVLSVNA